MPRRMEGKIAFVTGASQGIGEATAVRLAEEGARVVACARRPGPLADLAAKIRAADGQVEVLTLDVYACGAKLGFSRGARANRSGHAHPTDRRGARRSERDPLPVI